MLVERRWSKKHDCCVRCGRSDLRHRGRGLCNGCYQPGVTPDKPKRATSKPIITCPGCNQTVEHHAKGVCQNCYYKLPHVRKVVNQRNKQRYAENPEAKKAQREATDFWMKTHPEAVAKIQKRYAENHPKKMKSKNRRRRERYRTDPEYRERRLEAVRRWQNRVGKYRNANMVVGAIVDVELYNGYLPVRGVIVGRSSSGAKRVVRIGMSEMEYPVKDLTFVRMDRPQRV